MTDKIKEAARMAGAWWAERLSADFAHGREAFALSVEKHVLQELQGVCHWDYRGERKEGPSRDGWCKTENDYNPMYCLIPALRESFPDKSIYQRAAAIPRKTSLDITSDALEPKEGYGNWTKAIPVPDSTP